MFSKFPLFQSHIDLAHSLWEKAIKPGDIVIDATCGNGHDTLALAKMALTSTSGCLFALDKQTAAIDSCQNHLSKQLPKNIYEKISFILGCHSRFPLELAPESVSLIVYNLGYLPRGDKTMTTTTETTLISVENALQLIKKGGMISITCYPGHEEGKIETNKLLEYVTKLNPRLWSCCHHSWINRESAPSLLIIQSATEGPRQLDSSG